MKNCISEITKRARSYGQKVFFGLVFDFFGKSRVDIYEEGGVPNRPENNIS